MKTKIIALIGLLCSSVAIVAASYADDPPIGSFEYSKRQDDDRRRWEAMQGMGVLPPRPVNYHAAIAFSASTGRIGHAYGYESLGEAQEHALKSCSADDAQVVIWAQNAYCTLVLAADRSVYGAAWGDYRRTAEQKAIADCQSKTDQQCAVAITVGSSDNRFASIAYSRTMREVGIGYEHLTQEQAEKAARSLCRGQDAQIVVGSMNGYCALAESEDGSAIGVGRGNTRELAASLALEQCQKNSAMPCRLIAIAGPEHNRIAAIAYSLSTGAFFSVGDLPPRQWMMRLQGERLRTGIHDLQLVAWAINGSCAVAISDDRKFAIGYAISRTDAEQKALSTCQSLTSQPCRIAASAESSLPF